MINDYTVIDIETTGLNPKQDRIIEIAAIRVRSGEVAGEFSALLNPGRGLSQRIVDLTGISQEDVTDAPDISQVMPEFIRFIGEDILVGHQIMFDYAFLKRAAQYLKLAFEKKGIDTLKLARKLLPELESKSLGYLSEYFHIPHKPHRAMGDAMATKILYERLSEIPLFEQQAQPKILNYKIKKETPITKAQKEQLYKLTAKHKIVIEYEIERLTRNEASRIMDKIFVTYGR